MQPPLVSAVLPFGKPQRLKLARKAVNTFLRQHYVPFELVIVNGTDTDVLTSQEMDSDEVRQRGCSLLEIRAPAGHNAAWMKNRGIEAAHGEWIFPIDDDDWNHPQRLLYQMAHRRHDHPCTLRHQLRVDVSEPVKDSLADGGDERVYRPTLHLLDEPESGVASTLLFPRYASPGVLQRYDDTLDSGENEELLGRMRRSGRIPVVCDNSHGIFVQGMHWPILSVAIFHGGNELDRLRFFPGLDPQAAKEVPRGLNASDVAQLKVVLQSYNFEVK